MHIIDESGSCPVIGMIKDMPNIQPSLFEYKKSSKQNVLDLNITPPTSRYILTEMKKLWPKDVEEICEKKKNILKVKIDKLQRIIEEKVQIEEVFSPGTANKDSRVNLDLMYWRNK